MVHSRFNSPSFGTREQPTLTISMWRGTSSWIGSLRPMIEYEALFKIRATQGVERIQFIGPKQAEGMLAVTWNEEASQPMWG
ncbi:hypothetical protein M407DRAFT_244191 [Tulasnella calospora MUT 4182]|uniref:Uncharacterized protein n=1 Tax=Tulasnella calospora MUT 4182 TaxID=1051891 RepID=A0A0C3QFX4_9AGAM|nr:hypothetical protein M407DRAFT_244191 [Tulasnella calospora MUT 4182]